MARLLPIDSANEAGTQQKNEATHDDGLMDLLSMSSEHGPIMAHAHKRSSGHGPTMVF